MKKRRQRNKLLAVIFTADSFWMQKLCHLRLTQHLVSNETQLQVYGKMGIFDV